MEGGERWIEHGAVDTVYTADSVEFCPIEGYQSFFVIGTYQLNKEEGRRVGRLWLYEAQKQKDQILKKEDQYKMVETHNLYTKGILDSKWNFHLMNDAPVLAGANEGPELALWSLTSHEDKKTLTPLDSQTLGDPLSSIFLSLDWNNRLQHCANPSIVVSQSDLRISVWECTPSGLACTEGWDAHDHEVWIAAFNHWQPNLIYSGSDDCYLKGWDLRMDKSRPLFAKRHDMGVTTMQTHPHCEHYLATGSYDENVSLWDLRMMSRREPLKKEGMGGGVWRIKWHPTDPSRMLVACMHNGFKILNWEKAGGDTPLFVGRGQEQLPFAGEDVEVKEVVHCTRHGEGQLGYGADWSYHPDSPALVGTCSFYNHLCVLWQHT